MRSEPQPRMETGARADLPVNRPLLLVLASSLTAGVLILDALADPAVAVGMIYSVVVLILSFARRPPWVITGALVCIFLMILSAGLWPPGISWESQAPNLLLSASLVTTVAGVSIRGIQFEAERDRAILKHAEALREIRLLQSALPACAWCKRIREDNGEWISLEAYIERHTDTGFTHGICGRCSREQLGVELNRPADPSPSGPP